MPANTAPIFTNVPVIGAGTWLPTNTANTRSDGVGTIGTDMVKLFTAGTNGSFVNRIRLTPSGASATATTLTAARFYISTVTSGATTAANTWLFSELTLVAQSVAQTSAAAASLDVPCGFYIPNGYFIHMSMQAAAAVSTQWTAIVFGGNY